VKGWATCVNTEELKKFFKDVKIADNGAAIYIEHDPQRRPTGMAMVKFECETDYITALGMDLRLLYHIPPAYKTLLQYYCLPFYYQFFLELQNMLVNYKS
jgi:hypothetical protein